MLTNAAFNDVAEHDILWEELRIPFANDWDEPINFYKERYLSLGLVYLHRVVTAKTYDDRYKLLSLELDFDHLFLYKGLKVKQEDDGVPLPKYPVEHRQALINSSFTTDDDIGPFKAWS